MKMSWVTLDRICREEARAADIRRMVESTGRPLRSSAEHLSDEELLEKLRGFGVDLDRVGLEKLCEGALSAEEVARPLQDRRGDRWGRPGGLDLDLPGLSLGEMVAGQGLPGALGRQGAGRLRRGRAERHEPLRSDVAGCVV